MIRLSYIVPVFNVEQYLRRCIESILFQNLPSNEYEIILVDDGSPDNSGAICDEYSMQYDNVKVIHKPNGGLSDARNAGMEIASGSYIFFVDSDDYLIPCSIEEVLNVAEKNDLDLCHFHALVKKSLSIIWFSRSFEYYKLYSGESILLAGYTVSSVWTSLYRKETITNNCLKFSIGIVHEDCDFNYRYYAFCKRVMFTEYCVYIYEDNQWSLSRSNDVLSLQRNLKHDLLLVRSIRIFAGSNDISKKLQTYYYRRSNSIIISVLLTVLKDARLSCEFLAECVDFLHENNLLPIREKTQSFKTTLLIPIINNQFIIKILKNVIRH